MYKVKNNKLYYKIDKDLYKQVSDELLTSYEFIDDYFVEVETLEMMIRDLLNEIDYKKEKFKDYKQEVEDNMVARKKSEDYGFSKNDFI